MRYFFVTAFAILGINILAAMVAIGIGIHTADAPYLRIYPDSQPRDERLSYLWDTRTGVLLPERKSLYTVINADIPRNERHVVHESNSSTTRITLDQLNGRGSVFLINLDRSVEEFYSYFWAQQQNRIWIISNTESTTILRGFEPDTGQLMQEFEYEGEGRFSVAPNQRWAVYQTTVERSGYRAYQSNLISLQTGDIESLGQIVALTWSLDSLWLAYELFNPESNSVDIIVVSPETGERYQNSFEGEVGFGWSPNSQYIAYQQKSSTARTYRIQVRNIDDFDVILEHHMTIADDEYLALEWAENNPTLFVIQRTIHPPYSVFVTILDATNANISQQSQLMNDFYSISPDGRYIVSNIDNTIQIVHSDGIEIVNQTLPFPVSNIEFATLPTQ